MFGGQGLVGGENTLVSVNVFVSPPCICCRCRHLTCCLLHTACVCCCLSPLLPSLAAKNLHFILSGAAVAAYWVFLWQESIKCLRVVLTINKGVSSDFRAICLIPCVQNSGVFMGLAVDDIAYCWCRGSVGLVAWQQSWGQPCHHTWSQVWSWHLQHCTMSAEIISSSVNVFPSSPHSLHVC